jgi:uncharacterized protein (DUF433 family)
LENQPGCVIISLEEQVNDRIVVDPEIQHGKPIIRGTRVPVARVIGGLAGGMSKQEVMREYEISEEDVLAALSYAAQQHSRAGTE